MVGEKAVVGNEPKPFNNPLPPKQATIKTELTEISRGLLAISTTIRKQKTQPTKTHQNHRLNHHSAIAHPKKKKGIIQPEVSRAQAHPGGLSELSGVFRGSQTSRGVGTHGIPAAGFAQDAPSSQGVL